MQAFAAHSRFGFKKLALAGAMAAALASSSLAVQAQTASAAAVPAASAATASPQAQALHAQIDERAKAIEQKLIAWRRDIHEHPELGNLETRTSALGCVI